MGAGVLVVMSVDPALARLQPGADPVLLLLQQVQRGRLREVDMEQLALLILQESTFLLQVRQSTRLRGHDPVELRVQVFPDRLIWLGADLYGFVVTPDPVPDLLDEHRVPGIGPPPRVLPRTDEVRVDAATMVFRVTDQQT